MAQKKAVQEFLQLVNKTESMQQLTKAVEEEPARILLAICREYEATREPVSDHRIHISGFIGEMALKSLSLAGLITIKKGGHFALYQYVPTEEGLAQYKNLSGN